MWPPVCRACACLFGVFSIPSTGPPPFASYDCKAPASSGRTSTLQETPPRTRLPGVERNDFYPDGVLVGSSGNIFVADMDNCPAPDGDNAV